MEEKEQIIKIKKECQTMLMQMNQLYDQLQNHFAGFITNFPSNWQFHFLYLKDKYKIDTKCPHCEKGQKVLKYQSKYNYYFVECNERGIYNKNMKMWENNCQIPERETIKDSEIIFDQNKLSSLNQNNNS